MIISRSEFKKILVDDSQGFTLVIYLDLDGKFRLTLIKTGISKINCILGNMKGEIRYFSSKALKKELIDLGVRGSVELYVY